MKVILNRQQLGIEDLVFGHGTVMQTRGGVDVEITKIDAENIPYGSGTLGDAVNSIDPEKLVHKDSSTGAALLPTGTTAQRPATPSIGATRYNTELNTTENWTGTAWMPTGGQLLGTAVIKGVQFMSSVSAPNETITVTSGLNAFSVDSFTLADGASIVVEDNAVYKVL